MVMEIGSSSLYSSNNQSVKTGLAASVLGMSAYFLPVTKDRFIRTAYNIVKNDNEDLIERFNDAAIGVSSKNLKKDQKLFLAQNGVNEDFDAINSKVRDLRRILTDDSYIRNLKANFADNFNNFKTSEAMMDNIASRAFKQIRWTNFAWGAGILFILGSAFGADKK